MTASVRRSARALAVLVVAFALLLAGELALTASAHADPVTDNGQPLTASTPAWAHCTPNETDASTLRLPRKRCINQVALDSRGYIAPICFQWPLQSVPYAPSQCLFSGNYRGAEYIAQARFISWRSSQRGTYASGWVSPDLEWETNLPGAGRLDVLEYDSSSTAQTAASVWELKGWWNSDYSLADEQVGRYVLSLKSHGMPDRRPYRVGGPLRDLL